VDELADGFMVFMKATNKLKEEGMSFERVPEIAEFVGDSLEFVDGSM
jgi:hypothetical protein